MIMLHHLNYTDISKIMMNDHIYIYICKYVFPYLGDDHQSIRFGISHDSPIVFAHGHGFPYRLNPPSNCWPLHPITEVSNDHGMCGKPEESASGNMGKNKNMGESEGYTNNHRTPNTNHTLY